MPLHSLPLLRAREEALEAAGIIKTLDSAGITLLKNQEGLGRPKVVPKVTFTTVNTTYKAK